MTNYSALAGQLAKSGRRIPLFKAWRDPDNFPPEQDDLYGYVLPSERLTVSLSKRERAELESRGLDIEVPRKCSKWDYLALFGQPKSRRSHTPVRQGSDEQWQRSYQRSEPYGIQRVRPEWRITRHGALQQVLTAIPQYRTPMTTWHLATLRPVEDAKSLAYEQHGRFKPPSPITHQAPKYRWFCGSFDREPWFKTARIPLS
jgi:hypothetical protein